MAVVVVIVAAFGVLVGFVRWANRDPNGVPERLIASDSYCPSCGHELRDHRYAWSSIAYRGCEVPGCHCEVRVGRLRGRRRR